MKYVLFTGIVAAIFALGCASPDQTATRELTEQISALAVEVQELGKTNAELRIAASVTDSTLEQALNTHAQASQALAAQTRVLALEVADLGDTNAELAKSVPDPGQSQALTRQIEALTREIKTLSQANAQLTRALARIEEPLRSSSESESADQGICSRSPEVQEALIERLNIVACSIISPGELFRLRELSIEGRMFKQGDFADMPSLIYLRLYGVEELPTRAFDGLTSLQHLDLQGNGLTSLPEGVFAGLSDLESLRLGNNRLARLPNGVFTGLGGLKELDLSNNRWWDDKSDEYQGLNLLLPGIFDDLANLEVLNLQSNAFTVIPSDAFKRLPALRYLQLGDNPGESFEIQVATIGVAANLEGSGFTIVDR